jgi:hypothetical protein
MEIYKNDNKLFEYDYLYNNTINNNINNFFNTNIYITTNKYHIDDNFIPIIDEDYFEKCYFILKKKNKKRLYSLYKDYHEKENIHKIKKKRKI